jgi:NADPH:quinone reductase
MKAFVLDSPGSPDTLHLTDIEKPTPQKGQIRIQVHSVGLNPIDYKIAATGHPSWKYPFILGLDVAGVVDAVGEKVTEWKEGDLVYYHGDFSKPGGFAEYALTSAHTAAPLPPGLSFEKAAALPCAGLTAYQSLYRKINLNSIKSILIHGGAGGVGGFAIQLAALNDITIITTCSKNNFEWVEKLGAKFMIDYNTENIRNRVKDLTEGRGVDVVLNTIGAESAAADISNLAYNGHLICVAGLPDTLQINAWERSLSVHSIALGGAHTSGDLLAQRDLAKMGEEFGVLASEKKINPMLEEVISFEDIPTALKRLSERHVRGKIVAKLC